MPRKTSTPIKPRTPRRIRDWDRYMREIGAGTYVPKRDPDPIGLRAQTLVFHSRAELLRWFSKRGCPPPGEYGFEVVRRPDGRWIVVLAKKLSPLPKGRPSAPPDSVGR